MTCWPEWIESPLCGLKILSVVEVMATLRAAFDQKRPGAGKTDAVFTAASGDKGDCGLQIVA